LQHFEGGKKANTLGKKGENSVEKKKQLHGGNIELRKLGEGVLRRASYSFKGKGVFLGHTAALGEVRPTNIKGKKKNLLSESGGGEKGHSYLEHNASMRRKHLHRKSEEGYWEKRSKTSCQEKKVVA